MLDNDALQDLLSSLGPFRLHSVHRRGIVTTSVKAYDLHAHQHYLFKIYRDTPATLYDDVFAVVSATNGGELVVRRRVWMARCLRERLNQFPYMTEPERLFVYGQVRRSAGMRVKVSNVMLTPWNRVVIVDDCEYYDDHNRTCLLDDTEPAVSMASLAGILELQPKATMNDFTGAYLCNLALFKTQSCFERAAYLTVEQVLETVEDVLFGYPDLLSLLVMCLISVVKVSNLEGTKVSAFGVIAKCLHHLDPTTLKWYVLPAAMDCLSGQNTTVLRVMCLKAIHHIHEHVEPIKRHRVKRLLKAEDRLLMGLFAGLFGDVPLMCEYLNDGAIGGRLEGGRLDGGRLEGGILEGGILEGGRLDGAKAVGGMEKYVNSVDCRDELSIVECISGWSGRVNSNMLQLACKVYDQMEMERHIVPLLDGNLHHWAYLMLKQKISVHCLLAHMQRVPGLPSLASKIGTCPYIDTDALDLDLDLDDDLDVDDDLDDDQQGDDATRDELLEVDDECKGTGPPPSPFTRLRQSMRFWLPTRQTVHLGDMEKFRGVVSVSANDHHVCVFTTTHLHLYHHDGFPMKRPVKQIPVAACSGGLLCRDSSILVVTGGGGGQQVVQRVEGGGVFRVEGRVVLLWESGGLLHIITQSHLHVLHAATMATHYTLPLPAPHTVTSADTSTNHAFLLAGTTDGHLLLVDLRARLLCNAVKVADTAIHSVCLQADWSARSEHKRPRAWIATRCGVRSVDVVCGAVQRSAGGGGGGEECVVVLTTMGAHHVVFASADGHIQYYDYRMDRRVSLGRVAGVSGMVFLEGCVFVVSDCDSRLLY